MNINFVFFFKKKIKGKLEDMMELTESLMRNICKEVLKNDSLRIRVVKKSFVNEPIESNSSLSQQQQQQVDPLSLSESALLAIDFAQKFARVSYVEELQKALGSQNYYY